MSCRHILKLHIVTRETTLTIFLLLVCIHTTNIYSYYLPKTYPPYHLNPLKPFRDWIPWLQFLFFCTIFRRYCFILYIFISVSPLLGNFSFFRFPVRSQLLILNHCFICQNPVLLGFYMWYRARCATGGGRVPWVTWRCSLPRNFCFNQAFSLTCQPDSWLQIPERFLLP